MTQLPSLLNRWLKWGLALPLITLNGWVLLQIIQYFEPLVTVFVLAAVFAFMLNYPVRFLETLGLGRGYAVLLVLALSGLVLMGLGVTLLPTLVVQISEIGTYLPDWSASFGEKLDLLQQWANSHRLPVNLNRLLGQLSDRLPTELQRLTDQALTFTLDAVGSLSEALLTVVLTLYLLLDGRRVWDGLFRWLPRTSRDRVRRELQQNFHSYFIGQATLSGLMSVTFSVVFFVLQVPYSLLLGLAIGVMALIPFGDVLAYLLICLVVATQSPTLAIKTLVIAVVIDQVIDQAIAPRILGGFTGLKPVWVLLALLVGTRIAGLSGLLIAVPVAGFVTSLLEDWQSTFEQQPDDPIDAAELPKAVSQAVSSN